MGDVDVDDDGVLREALTRAATRLRVADARAADAADTSTAVRDEVVTHLRHHRPQDGLLSGDRYRSPDRLDRTRVWLLKPLEALATTTGRAWATHLGLVVEGGVAAGGIAFSDRPPLVPPVAPAPIGGDAPRLVLSGGVDRDGLVAAQVFDREPRPVASLTEGLLCLLDGGADACLHFGGWEWDAAAAVAIGRAAGLTATSIDGTPLRFNHPAPVLDGVLLAGPDLARRLAAVLIRRAGRE